MDVVKPASVRSAGTSRPWRGLTVGGLVAVLAAVVATTLCAGLARLAGVDFEIPEGGETIPLTGFAFVTAVFSVAGIAIAAVFLRLSTRPAARFAWTAGALTAVSLVPPVLSGASVVTVTVIVLVGLHLVAAAVMVPALTRLLRG